MAAHRLWDEAEDVEDHALFNILACKPRGLKRPSQFRTWYQDGSGRWFPCGAFEKMLLPIFTSDGRIVSIQAIFQETIDGPWRKSLLGGGIVAGGHFAFGDLKSADRVMLCWDLELAAAIHASIKLPTMVVFSPSHLASVIENYRDSDLDREFVIAGTREVEGDNFGEDRAVIKGVNWSRILTTVRPSFSGFSRSGATFHDLYTKGGEQEVARQLFNALKIAPSEKFDCEKKRGVAKSVDSAPGHTIASHVSLEDCPFEILGHSDDTIHIYVQEGACIKCRAFSDWPESALTSIAPLAWWKKNFSVAGHFSRSEAVNWLQRQAYRRGYYTRSKSCGLGIWKDQDRCIYNFGGALDVDGASRDFHEIESDYIYLRRPPLGAPHPEPLSDFEGQELFQTALLFNWADPISAVLLLGWIALAPLCATLSWRPHLWVTGPAGSGKSTLLRDFVSPLLNHNRIFAHGSSTEAGIRREIGFDALPILFDEAEQNSYRDEERIQSILALMRQSSTETGAQILLGSRPGPNSHYIRSMFLLSSVASGIRQPADQQKSPNWPSRLDGWREEESSSFLHFDFCARATRARNYFADH